MKREIYKISGMHCASCALTIERTVSKLPGVKSAQVNFANESLLVEFDEKKISEKEIQKIVQNIGYDLLIKDKEIKPTPSSQRKVFKKQEKKFLAYKIIGMDSPHCAMIVEKALKTLPGIEKIEVDFSNQRAKVIFDPQKINSQRIEKVISEAGYQPIKETSEIEDVLEKEKREQERERLLLKKKIIVGTVLSLLIFLGSFPQWFVFVPKILTNHFTLLILTIPVQFWVGSKFYSGLRLLFKYKTADMNTLIAIGTLAAFLYSAAVTIFPSFFQKGELTPKVYFDTAAIIITLILLGR